jgi:hypothetical protein
MITLESGRMSYLKK